MWWWEWCPLLTIAVCWPYSLMADMSVINVMTIMKQSSLFLIFLLKWNSHDAGILLQSLFYSVHFDSTYSISCTNKVDWIMKFPLHICATHFEKAPDLDGLFDSGVDFLGASWLMACSVYSFIILIMLSIALVGFNWS